MLRLSVFMAGSLLSLAGCQQHRDFVDNTLEWTQRMRGGVIAAQRPPPPGQYDPYPHVGRARGGLNNDRPPPAGGLGVGG
ncbi:MAG: hypothetical protein ABF822_12275, partial [Acetobacter orientalis]